MSAATATIIGIAGIGAGIGGAAISARAAGKASQQQQQSAQQGLALQREMYQTTRGDLAPYRTQGGQGLTALTALLGLPGGAATAAPPLPSVAPEPSGVRTWTDPSGRPQRLPAVGSLYTPPGQVLLLAPNGQTRYVPADQADFYLARGARRM